MSAYFNMFKNYVNFSGHTSRGNFWKAILTYALVGGVLWGISVATGMVNRTFDPIVMGYSLVTALPMLAMVVRRLRDAGKSVWNLLWGLVPLVGWIVLAVKLARSSACRED